MMYERKYTIPSGNQVLAVADLDNPLVVRTGNPNLKASLISDKLKICYNRYYEVNL